MTLDEILERAGLTREEWQRAKSVVEDYWEPFARANGWEKRGHAAPRRLFRFPLFPDGEFTVTAPLTEDQWTVLMEVLEAARPGIISVSESAVSRGDDRSPVEEALGLLDNSAEKLADLAAGWVAANARGNDALIARTIGEHREALATVRAELERLTEELDAAERLLREEQAATDDSVTQRYRAESAEAEVSRLTEGLRERERLLRWALNYIGIDWERSYPDEPPAVTEARDLLAASPDGAKPEGGSK